MIVILNLIHFNRCLYYQIFELRCWMNRLWAWRLTVFESFSRNPLFSLCSSGRRCTSRWRSAVSLTLLQKLILTSWTPQKLSGAKQRYPSLRRSSRPSATRAALRKAAREKPPVQKDDEGVIEKLSLECCMSTWVTRGYLRLDRHLH